MTTVEPGTRCAASVPDGTFRGHRCQKPPRNFEDGRWYCTVHTPSARRAKADARYDAYKAASDARQRTLDRKASIESARAFVITTARSDVYLHHASDELREAVEALNELEGKP